MQHRTIRLERQPLIEIAAQPASCRPALPVHGMLSVNTLAPGPARLAPEFAPAVAFRLDELGEFALCDRRASNSKGTDFYGVRPLFVVEDERLFGKRSQQKLSPGDVGISGKRSGIAGTRWPRARKSRRAPRVSLTRVGEGLGVHVFVEHAQLDEIAFLIREVSALDAIKDTVAHGG